MIFYIYDRWGEQIGTLQDILSAKHKDELNGEDSLTLSYVGNQLIKGNRIVWQDKFFVWHEHTVVDMEVSHAGVLIVTNAYCENSVSELLTDYIGWKKPNGKPSLLLDTALEGTRWTVGSVETSGTYKTSWYHISAYEALQDIISIAGGEISTSITLVGSQVTERRVNILSHRGSATEKRFTYGRNLVDLTRIVDTEDVYTALYGYGKGIPTYDDNGEETGGYTNKITFGDINGGRDYVTDETAKKTWGLPDGKGGIKHTFGKVEFDDCEDPKELLNLTKEALKEYSKPKVRYSGTIANLAKAGFTNGEDSQTGDDVFIRDKILGERLTGRVLCVERDLLDEAGTVIDLGNIADSLTDLVSNQRRALEMLKNRSTNWSGAAEANQAWLKNMKDNLNEFMNATGGYAYWDEGEGITVYDKPRESNPSMAIQLNGAGFRIANSKKSNGEWNWSTFGTGDGFTADLINVGTLRCGTNRIDMDSGTVSFYDGLIQDTKSNNYWNLGTGELRMASTVKVGTASKNQTLEDYTKAQGQAAVDAQTQRTIFNKLTNNGQTQGIYLSDGKLYINGTYIKSGTIDASYIRTGYITDKYGRSTWDLDKGTLTTNDMVARNISASGTFECGSTYGIKLNNSGQLAGFRNGSQVGYIDYSAASTDVDTGAINYGIQMQAKGIVRISSPKISVANSSDVSKLATYALTKSNKKFISSISGSNGTINWTNSYASFINGFCTTFGS